MILTEGRHAGEQLELVFFTDPFYIRQKLFECYTEKTIPETGKNIMRLISKFDRKKFTAGCTICSSPAAVLVYFNDTLDHEMWCPDCLQGRIKDMEVCKQVMDNYFTALEYADSIYDGKRSIWNKVVEDLAEAKGLPRIFGEKEALEFFAGCQDIPAEDDWCDSDESPEDIN